MQDRTYAEAVLEATEGGRRTGPMPCQRCAAWVEWDGTAILNAGTDGEHECWPFLPDGVPPEEVVLVADWTRPSRPMPRVRMAHPVDTYIEPPWVRTLGIGLAWVVGGLMGAFIIAAVARYLHV